MSTTTGDIETFYAGSKPVEKLYIGSREVWTDGPGARVTPTVEATTRWLTSAYGFNGVQAGDLLVYMCAGVDPGSPSLAGGQIASDWNTFQNRAASIPGGAGAPPWYDVPAVTLDPWNNWVAWKIADGTETAATAMVSRYGYSYFGTSPNWVQGWRITGYDPALTPISLGNDSLGATTSSESLISKAADERLENGLMLVGIGNYRTFGSPTMDLTLDVDYGAQTNATENGGTSRFGEYYLPADGSVPAINFTTGAQSYRARRLYIPGARI